MLSEKTLLKETILPMQAIEGIAIKMHSSVNVTEDDSASLLILIGQNKKSLSATLLFENALIRWKNIKSNQYNEIPLFAPIKNKIPPVQIPQPVTSVTAEYNYTIEIIDLRSKLNLQWGDSKYTIQVVNGDWVSNTIEFRVNHSR